VVAIVITHPRKSERAEVSFIPPSAGKGESQDSSFGSISGRSVC
jgi:hypothetical protein